MDTPTAARNREVAYQDFIAQARREMEQDELPAEQIDAAVFGMQKAQLLFTGPPIETVLKHKTNPWTATRVIKKGIPQWEIVDRLGERWWHREPILQPEDDWRCIFDPDKEGEVNG